MIRSPAARAAAWLASGVVALLASAMVALAFGSQGTSLLRALTDESSLDRTLIASARLPRVALAAVSGGGLSVVGVAFQALLRNPLAEPYVLGVSGGAALGASLAIALGVGTATVVGASAIPFAACVGGLLATLVVYWIARRGGPASGTTILLAGVIVNALAAALVTLLKTLVSASKAQELLFWLMGFLDVPSTTSLLVVSAYVLLGAAVVVVESGNLNLLALGEEPAAHLGVDVRRTERRVFFAASAVVGAVVSVTGLIGFVGLLVPHALRRLVGPDHRLLVPLSLLFGGAVLVLCDAAARALFRVLGTEPPVGAITAVVGGPLFLALLARQAVRWDHHGLRGG
jgi:iron complex transport system permease protein